MFKAWVNMWLLCIKAPHWTFWCQFFFLGHEKTGLGWLQFQTFMHKCSSGRGQCLHTVPPVPEISFGPVIFFLCSPEMPVWANFFLVANLESRGPLLWIRPKKPVFFPGLTLFFSLERQKSLLTFAQPLPVFRNSPKLLSNHGPTKHWKGKLHARQPTVVGGRKPGVAFGWPLLDRRGWECNSCQQGNGHSVSFLQVWKRENVACLCLRRWRWQDKIVFLGGKRMFAHREQVCLACGSDLGTVATKHLWSRSHHCCTYRWTSLFFVFV